MENIEIQKYFDKIHEYQGVIQSSPSNNRIPLIFFQVEARVLRGMVCGMENSIFLTLILTKYDKEATKV